MVNFLYFFMWGRNHIYFHFELLLLCVSNFSCFCYSWAFFLVSIKNTKVVILKADIHVYSEKQIFRCYIALI